MDKVAREDDAKSFLATFPHKEKNSKMKQILSCVLVMALGIPALGQEVCLDVYFTEGMPDDFILECYDQMPVKSQDFKNLYPEMTWFTRGQVNSADMSAAMSTSHRTVDMATDNWMITNQLHLSAENVWLKWTARAIHYHLRDGYKVMISVKGTDYDDFTELFSVPAEEYLWTKRIVSLNEYAGKDVYIAFVHDSHNKFLLAIDDIFVGQPAEADFIVEDNTRRFAGNVATVPVTGKVMNSGIEQGSYAFKCVVNGTDVMESPAFAITWKTGEQYPFEFDVPVQVGKATHYKVMIGEHTLVEDSIICSYYPRKILLEKGTGTWCTNCPEVISYIQELEERYGENLVCVEAHWGPENYGKDPFHYGSYTGMEGMKINNYPTIHFNRDRSNAVNGASVANRKVLGKIINKPTIAKVDLSSDYPAGDSVKVSAKVTFATDTDNSTGKFRVGYVLIEKEIQTKLASQINGGASIVNYHGEYYYMKSPVATDLMWYTNVVRGDKNAFMGIKGCLPAQIEAEKEYTVETNIHIPNTVYDKANLAVVAIVMNFYTDEVLNVAEVRIPENPQSVRPIVADNGNGEVRVTVDESGSLWVACPEQASFCIDMIATDGRQVATWTGEGSASWDVSEFANRGLYLLRISQNGRVWTKKIVF